MSEWQPIETAPRDGTLVLTCNSRTGTRAVVGWSKSVFIGEERPGWTDSPNAGEALYFNALYFDFWQPLPAPPVAA